MDTETYTIETDGHGGFQVRVERSPRDSGYVAINVPTYAQAREWIGERARAGNQPPPQDDPGYAGRRRGPSE